MSSSCLDSKYTEAVDDSVIDESVRNRSIFNQFSQDRKTILVPKLDMHAIKLESHNGSQLMSPKPSDSSILLSFAKHGSDPFLNSSPIKSSVFQIYNASRKKSSLIFSLAMQDKCT